jgi:hypothetical protein
MCQVYATIREATSKRSTTVCGGGPSRQKSVHVSVDHQVEIRIINSDRSPKPLIFVLKYEGHWDIHSIIPVLNFNHELLALFNDPASNYTIACNIGS